MKPVVFVEERREIDADSGARGEGRVLDLVKAELVEAVDEFEGDAVLVLARSGLLVEDFLAFDDAHVVLAEEGRERHFETVSNLSVVPAWPLHVAQLWPVSTFFSRAM